MDQSGPSPSPPTETSTPPAPRTGRLRCGRIATAFTASGAAAPYPVALSATSNRRMLIARARTTPQPRIKQWWAAKPWSRAMIRNALGAR